MKIYIDNELLNKRRVTYVQSNCCTDINCTLDTVINALRGLGYEDFEIQEGFLEQCHQWGYIEPKENV